MALLISDLGFSIASVQETLDAEAFFDESTTMPLLTADEAEWLDLQQTIVSKEHDFGSLAAAWVAEQQSLQHQVASLNARVELMHEVYRIDEATRDYEGAWPLP